MTQPVAPMGKNRIGMVDSIEMKLTDKLVAQFCPAYPMFNADTQRRVREALMDWVATDLMLVIREQALQQKGGE